jgi:ATP-dependent DNA helicase
VADCAHLSTGTSILLKSFPPPFLWLVLTLKRKFFYSLGKFRVPIGGSAKAGEARQTIAEMAAQLLELEGEHIEVVQSTAAGKRSIISDAELEMLLDRRKEVFEGRRVGWKSGAAEARSGGRAAGASAGKDTAPDENEPVASAGAGRDGTDSGLFEVFEAPVDEGNDALAHMLGEDIAA